MQKRTECYCENPAEFRGILYDFQKIPHSDGSKKSNSVDILNAMQVILIIGANNQTFQVQSIHSPNPKDGFQIAHDMIIRGVCVIPFINK
jgi:hypothetical protein